LFILLAGVSAVGFGVGAGGLGVLPRTSIEEGVGGAVDS
jgi:hypothetical protein